jgi:hypothetical protein
MALFSRELEFKVAEIRRLALMAQSDADDQNVVDLVDELAARFEGYSDLTDFLDLTLVVGRLGGKLETLSAAPTTVYDRIRFANAHWVTPVRDLIDEKDWHGEEYERDWSSHAYHGNDAAARDLTGGLSGNVWRGTAADVFHDWFIVPFHKAALQQMACAKILSLAAEVYRDGVSRMQNDILAIADACIGTLKGVVHAEGDNSFINIRFDFNDSSGTSGSLSIVSIGTGIVALFVPEVAVVLGVVSIGAGIVSHLAATAEEARSAVEWHVEGTATAAILNSTWDALNRFEQSVYDRDTELADGLRSDLDNNEAFASPALEVEQPDITSDSFGQLRSMESSLTIESIVDLYRAGFVNLPAAAEEYDYAATNLGDSQVPLWLRRYFPVSTWSFEEARGRLSGIVRRTRDKLAGAGEALVETASEYELTDDQSAEVLREFEEIAPAPPADRAPPVYPAPVGE